MMKTIDPTMLICERVGEELYAYYPLGVHVALAPGVCGGRPTFKRTRLEVAVVLALLAEGMSSQEIVAHYEASNLSREAIQEAIQLSNEAFLESTQSLLPLAA